MNALTLPRSLPIVAHNGGLFVSRGTGTHPDRTLSSYELIVVRSGALSIQEEETRFLVSSGDTLLLFPKRQHFGTQPYAKDLSFYWFHFDVSASPAEAGSPLLEVPRQSPNSSSATHDELMTLCRRFLDVQAEANKQTVFRCSLILLEMLTAIVSQTDRDGAVPVDSGTRLADRANALLRVRFAEPDLSTQSVAETLGVNPDYLGRVFRRTFGKPLTDVLHDYRLRFARSLLLDDSKNIAEVARVSGFADAGYFRRLFKRHHALSPQGFRRLHARVHVNTE